MGSVKRVLFLLSAALFVASFAIALWGIGFEVEQIPPEIRAKMSDTDWVGGDWAILGAQLGMFSFGLAIAGGLAWLAEKHASRRQQRLVSSRL